MNIEDGYDLPLRVTFEEEGGDSYWHCNLAVLPHVGDGVIIGSAPKGVKHVVCVIDHHVGAASHRIVIAVKLTDGSPIPGWPARSASKKPTGSCDDTVPAVRCRSAPRRIAMNAHPPFRKVLDRVATHEQMFRLFNRHSNSPKFDPLSGTPYSGEWFEIQPDQYHFMLGLLPPLFQRTGMFGVSEYKAGNVTSVFFAIRIRGRERWFHGFCDLSDRHSPNTMRAAIIAHETGAVDSMTREEKLEAIWNATHADFKGIAGKRDPDKWPVEHHGKRVVLVESGPDRRMKLLEQLSDDEIDIRISAVRARLSRKAGGDDADPA